MLRESGGSLSREIPLGCRGRYFWVVGGSFEEIFSGVEGGSFDCLVLLEGDTFQCLGDTFGCLGDTFGCLISVLQAPCVPLQYHCIRAYK